MNNFQWEDKITEQIPRLRRYAMALIQNKACADDLVQDCLEKAWNKRHSWSEGSNLRAWLFTIMHNLFINGIRRNQLQQTYLSQAEPDTFSNTNELQHAVIDLQTCLVKLKPELREVIILAGLENLSYKEIADITGSPMGTVMSRLSRGRAELRQLMSGVHQPKLVRIK